MTSGAVRAQSIDDYLNASIAGTGVAPGVTVLSRARPEYEVEPLHLGSFLVTPELAETIGYDDNVTGTPSAHGSALIETNATLAAVSDWSLNSLGVNLGVDSLEYPSQPSQSYTNWSGSVAGTHDFGRDTLYVSYTHLNLNETSRDLDTPELTQPIPYRVDNGRLSYNAEFSHAALQPTLDVESDSYDNGTVGSVVYPQGYRDRVVVSPSIEARYEEDPLRSVVLVLRDSEASYANQLPGLASRDFSDVSALGGFNYDTGGLIRLRLLAGYEVRTFSSSQYKTISAPIVEGSAIYTPTGLTTVTATAARYIEDSAADLTVGYTETELKLRVDHEYLRNVLLFAQAALYLDDYAQGGGQQSLYNTSAGVTWLMNRNMQLSLTYSFQTRQSDASNAATGTLGTGELFGSNYSENQLLLQLRVGL